MTIRKKILVIVFSNLRHDARVKRQISFLSEEFNVTVLCFASEEIQGVRIVRLNQTPLTLTRKAISGLFLISGFYTIGHQLLHSYSYIKSELKNEDFDLIIANDVETLPLAFQLSRNQKVYFDAHEYAPLHFEDKLWWRVFFKRLNTSLCKKYIPIVQGMTTVGEGLAKEYEKNFKVRPIVITNAPYYHNIQSTEVINGKVRLVYHGIANPSRRIELMIEMMSHLDDRFTLDLILMTSDFASGKTKAYIENLKTTILSDSRIKILPQLNSKDVISFINKYDVGVFLIPPVNFNYANTLPNKLFEYIQARLTIAVGPTPEMANMVKTYDIGVVSEDFSAIKLAEKLSSLTGESIKKFKTNASVAAREQCAENNKMIFLKEIHKILEKQN